MIVILAMAIMANYPMYETLREASEELDLIVQAVQAEIIGVQEDVSVISERIDVVRKEFAAVADSTLSQIDSTLNVISSTAIAKVDSLKARTDQLELKINEAVKGAVDKSLKQNEKKIKQIIPGLPTF
tara:strand:- start:2231 stop:2614 length:384 start_codon:yes stop_codon:yes gene_type:complete